MKAAKKISPEDYILAALSTKERLEAAFTLTREAYKNSPLKLADVQAALQKVRKKAYAERQTKSPGRR